jgi:hypothetical protein
VETERRNAEEQVPLRQIEDISLQIATWLRLSFERFLNTESPGLMAIKDLGEFKFSAIERCRGILHRTVKGIDWKQLTDSALGRIPGDRSLERADTMNRNSKRRAKAELKARRQAGVKLVNPKSKGRHPCGVGSVNGLG